MSGPGVTADANLLALKTYRDVIILGVRDFLATLQGFAGANGSPEM